MQLDRVVLLDQTAPVVITVQTSCSFTFHPTPHGRMWGSSHVEIDLKSKDVPSRDLPALTILKMVFSCSSNFLRKRWN